MFVCIAMVVVVRINVGVKVCVRVGGKVRTIRTHMKRVKGMWGGHGACLLPIVELYISSRSGRQALPTFTLFSMHTVPPHTLCT